MSEYAVTIGFAKQTLLSIIHPGQRKSSQTNNDIGVLIVVGGPQYRVGSHRQFVQLARSLAQGSISTMRFDYRGMGDSGGDKVEFDNICNDIKVAIDTFLLQQPELKRIVIWGLCDAASAALIYAHKDPRVAALVIANPWLRNQQAMAKTMARHYYLQRLLSKAFWQKLLSGKVNLAASVKDTKGYLADSLSSTEHCQQSYQSRMEAGLQSFTGQICLILSGNDLTAKEFEQQTLANQTWQKLHLANNQIHRLEPADHTFSSQVWKRQVEQLTLDFINQLKN